VSLDVGEHSVSLVKWEDDEQYPIPLSSGCYRVRYCAMDMQQGKESLGDEGIVDFYHLAFWRAAKKNDEIIKQTSKAAQYWHQNVCKP
jgi:hypothetical protein